VLRRIAHLAIAVTLGAATLLAILAGGVANGMVHSSPATVEGALPLSRSTGSSITTAHGVVILTTPATSFRPRASRLVLPGAHFDTEMAPALRMLAARQELPVTPLGRANTSGFDAALTDLASSSGTAITRSTAKMVDYPNPPAADDNAPAAVRAPVLLALAVLVAATVGMIPTGIRLLRRRHLNRHHHN